MSTPEIHRLIRTKQRVADHGEVFTPPRLVEDMLDLVRDETERIDSRFLEPACGSGNFLVAVLTRKLASVQRQYGRDPFERRQQAMLALMCVYGIELLEDNAHECRDNLLACATAFVGAGADDVWTRAAVVVLAANIVHGDALAMSDHDGAPIVFPEWAYLTRGQFQRRDFSYRDIQGLAPPARRQLALSPALDPEREANQQLSLPTSANVFKSIREYPRMTIAEISAC